MRIAIDARKIEVPLTGIGRYTRNLLMHLSNLDMDNEYVVFRGRDFQDELTLSPNFKTVTVDYPSFSVRSLLLLHQIVHREKIDLFHSPFISAPLLANCKILVTVHDLIPLKFAKTFGHNRNTSQLLRKWMFRVVLSVVTKRADAIITVSWSSKRALQKLDPTLGRKTKVIYEGAETIFRAVPSDQGVSQTRARFGLKDNCILYVGMIRPHKNLVRLFQAIGRLVHDMNQSCHLIIGGGKEGDLLFLRNFAKELGISESVSFVQNLDDTDLVKLMRAADVFVFPSLEEGFGLPPLEAMACGVPVVASNVSSLPEVLGDAALLVNPYNVQDLADALERVLIDAKLRRELVEKGLKRAASYSWEDTARQTLQVYMQTARKR